MDVIAEAQSKLQRNLIVLACDTDFVPLAKQVREQNKANVILYYYNDYIRHSKFSMSNYMLTECTKSIIIDKSYFEAAIFHPV